MLALLLTLLSAGAVPPAALPAHLSPALARELSPWHATLLVLDPATGARLVAGDGSPAARSSPCSTFKVFHSLVGLETGLLKDLDHPYAWDGVKRERAEDSRDHTLRTAIRDSVLWYYQRLARELGEAREKEFLAKAGYGNQDPSSGLTSFWVEGSLQVSPEEQVAFLARLAAPAAAAEGAPPFSARSVRLLREGLHLRHTPRGDLYGKTGTASAGKLGWFVGWVEQGAQRRVFALRLERRGKEGAPASGKGVAQPLAERLLEGLGLL